jgi:hypothetical protein
MIAKSVECKGIVFGLTYYSVAVRGEICKHRLVWSGSYCAVFAVGTPVVHNLKKS